MKKSLLTIVTAAASLMQSAAGQSGFLVYFDTLQASFPGSGKAVKQVDDGFLVFTDQNRTDTILGTSSSPTIRKLDQAGNVVWSKTLFTPDGMFAVLSFLRPDPVSTTDTGDFIFTLSQFTWSDPWGQALRFYRINANADTILTRELLHYPEQDSTSVAANQTIETKDGGAAVVGRIDPMNGARTGWLLRLNEFGDTLWFRKYPLWSSDIYSIAQMHDGGFAMCGARPLGTQNYILIRTDPTGAVLWTSAFGGYERSQCRVKTAADSSIVVWSTSYGIWSADFLDTVSCTMHRWLDAPALDKQTSIHSPYLPGAIDLVQQSDGSWITVGDIWKSHAWRFIKFDQDLDTAWTRIVVIDSNHTQIVQDVEIADDGGIVATGIMIMPTVPPSNSSILTGVVVKLDSMGCLVPGCHIITGMEAQATNLRDALRVYPNPVAGGGNVTVEITLPEGLRQQPLRLSLISADGRLVREEKLPAFSSSFSFPPSALHSGIYMLHLSTPDTWLSGTKLVVE